MINEKLKTLLLERDEKSHLKFKVLVDFLERSEYEFIGTTLLGVYGFAIPNKAYFNIPDLKLLDNQHVYHIILHEYCHVLRINKIGKDGMIKCLSATNLKDYLDHVIEEEIIADRFAMLHYYLLNGETYPKYRTQQLWNEEHRVEFMRNIKPSHRLITDEKSYNELVEYHIIDGWTDIEEEQPIWYRNVELIVHGRIEQHWHRLDDGDSTYYGSMETNRVIEEDDVSHWRYLKDKKINE